MPVTRNGSCPKCGTRVGWVRRWIKSAVWNRWNCRRCGARLKFDLRRRVIVACAGGLMTGVFVVAADSLRWWTIPLAIVVFAAIWSFDAVRLADEETSALETPEKAGA